MTTAQDAINSITSGMTVDQLKALANTVDAHAPINASTGDSGSAGDLHQLTNLRKEEGSL